MFINKIYLNDKEKRLVINDISFGLINILVGISGSGKTTIVHAISTLVAIANGRSSPSDKWRVEFETDENKSVIWSGEFSESIGTDENNEPMANLISESIIFDNTEIIRSDDQKIIFNGMELPQLDKLRSLIYILRDAPEVKKIYTSLQKIRICYSSAMEHNERLYQGIEESLSDKIKEFVGSDGKSALQIVNEFPSLDCRKKLYYAHMHDKDGFENFVFAYASLFPSVKNIKIRNFRTGEGSKKRMGINLVLNDDTNVPQSAISSGMFKSMMILSELIFSPKNFVMVIDEIENSLGVNCLPDILNEIKASEIQCIVSTHHPRVIDGVSPQSWRIVNRKGGVINATLACSIINSESNHDKFIQLINDEIYRNGVQS